MDKYEWSSPSMWLLDRMKQMEVDSLRSTIITLTLAVGNDEIQDIFQEEMDKDGYFDKLEEENND